MRVVLLTVGDEILAGDTVNTNAAWLAEQLTERGVDVERITVVPDRIADIAETVDAYRTQYDAVIVTGGIGPTHDDVTMEALATAFDVALVEDQAALDWLAEHRDYAREDLADGTAAIPAGARMIPNREGVAPGCVLANVYVFPGVPEEMQEMFDAVADDFTGEARHVEVVHVDEPESALLDRIETLGERFDVTVGSYPGETVRIKLSGRDQDAVERATAWLRERVELADSA